MDWKILYSLGMIMTAVELRNEFDTYKKYSLCYWLCIICVLLWPVLACIYLVVWIINKIREAV